jgi:hypothetical protein
VVGGVMMCEGHVHGIIVTWLTWHWWPECPWKPPRRVGAELRDKVGSYRFCVARRDVCLQGRPGDSRSFARNPHEVFMIWFMIFYLLVSAACRPAAGLCSADARRPDDN